MKEPMVSIVIPVYNTEKYIEESVLSLLNQSYKNIEIILIDDGSVDDSYQICKRLSEKNRNIIVEKHEKNMSQAVARNTGISLATGEYLLFLDSDDTLLPETVEEMVNRSMRDDADIVLSSFSRVINGKINIVYEKKLEERVYSSSDISNLLFDTIPLNVLFCIGTKLYRIDLIRSNKIKFDKIYRYNEDGAFAIIAFKYAKKISYIDKPYYQYLLRDDNSSQISYRKNMFNSISKARELVKDFLNYNNSYEYKKNQYQSMIFDLIIASFINEIRYKKDYDGVYKKVKASKICEECLNYYKSSKKDLLHSVLFYFLKHNRKNMLRYSLTFNEIIKKVK